MTMDTRTEESDCDDKATVTVTEHLLIRDGDTGEVYVNQRGTLSTDSPPTE